jgi:hypothetical protein
MSTSAQSIESRPCSFCGQPVRVQLNRCPYCREEIPEVRLSAPPASVRPGKDGRREIRRGLLYMLLGAVVDYFAAGYSGMKLPDVLNSALVVYCGEFLFVAGLGLSLYGCYLRIRS